MHYCTARLILRGNLPVSMIRCSLYPLTPLVPTLNGTAYLVYMDGAHVGVAEEASCHAEGIGDDDDEQAVSLEVSIPCLVLIISIYIA